MSSHDRLSALRSKVNTAYKGEIAAPASSRTIHNPRVTTGSIALDYAMGVEPGGIAGLPLGRVTMFLGQRSSGKTTSALKVVANAQRLCSRCYRLAHDVRVAKILTAAGAHALDDNGRELHELQAECDCYAKGLWKPATPKFAKKSEETAWQEQLAEYTINSYESFSVAYFDVEDALDLDWARRNGVILEVLEHLVPSSAEQCIDVGDEYLKSGAIDLLVLDSIAAMVPMAEKEASTEDWQQGLQARLVNKMVRKFVGDAAEVKMRDGKLVTQLWINQYREKIGMGGKTTPGGKGQNFATSVEVEFFSSDFKEEFDIGFLSQSKTDQVKVATEVRTNFNVVKNKTAKPKIKGSYRMALRDDGVIKASDVLEQEYMFKLASHYELIEKKGNKYIFRGREFTTQSAINALIVSEPAVAEWTRREVLERLAGYK